MARSIVFRKIPAVDQSLVDAVREFSVADLHESLDPIYRRMGLMSPRMRPLNPEARICGQAVTAFNSPGDALAVHKAVQIALPGQVLVLSSGGCGPTTMCGELVALAARKRGVLGFIVDGGIRDTSALRLLAFPVWSTSVCALHVEKRGPAAVNVPLVCDGVYVQPGDVISADSDGVIVIPLAMLEEVIRNALAREAREAEMRTSMDAGEALFDLMKFNPTETTDVVEIDSTWADRKDRSAW